MIDKLLNKVTTSNLDPAAATGEKAISLWKKICTELASSPMEKAYCNMIIAEYMWELKQKENSIAALRKALNLLQPTENSHIILTIKASLSQMLVDNNEYQLALNEYSSLLDIAVEYGETNQYITAILGMGSLCSLYGDHERALRYYQKVDNITSTVRSRTMRLRYCLATLKCYISLNRTKIAYESLRECEELSVLVSDNNLTGYVHLYHAQLLREQGDYQQALLTIAKIQDTPGLHRITDLSTLTKIELAYILSEFGRTELASAILYTIEKRLSLFAPVAVNQYFLYVASLTLEKKGLYKEALLVAKQSLEIESELIRNIPLNSLGSGQLRHISRHELELKLALSEIENQELKETSLQHETTVAQLQQDALTDPLTQLHNRRWLETKLKSLIKERVPFALLLIDIDNFKQINDTLSHLVGDKALAAVSNLLKSEFNTEKASCIRFGGEEFLVILEQTNLTNASKQADLYRRKISQFDWQPVLGERSLTVSIGITTHRDGEHSQHTFYRADKALYRAKASGRNQACMEI